MYYATVYTGDSYGRFTSDGVRFWDNCFLKDVTDGVKPAWSGLHLSKEVLQKLLCSVLSVNKLVSNVLMCSFINHL